MPAITFKFGRFFFDYLSAFIKINRETVTRYFAVEITDDIVLLTQLIYLL